MSNTMHKVNSFKVIGSAILIISGITVTLFAHWEPSPESWIYWLFSRIFAETGRFIIIDRSPLYTLYLNAFSWIGYPTSVTVEYVATTLIMVSLLIIFFRRYMGLFWATFAVLLWLPFLQSAEPPVQKLALAFSCLAIVVRDMKASRFRLAISYALLGLAYMFRCTYIVFIVIFVIWDSIRIFRQRRLKGFFAVIRPKRSDWPILIILILLLWFNIMQSPHKWNNASCITSRWFPANTKTLTDSAFIQNHNMSYTFYKYGTFIDKDFYFTNQELFNGAKTMKDAIFANPGFVVTQLFRNVKTAIGITVNFTLLPYVYKSFSFLGPFYNIIVLSFIVSFLYFIIWGIFRICNNSLLALFFAGNFFLIGTTLLTVPKERYMQPLIPILILSAFWWGSKMRNTLRRFGSQTRFAKQLFSMGSYLTIPIFLILFSNGPLTGGTWQAVIADIAGDIRGNKVKVMERRPYSLKASFKSLQPIVQSSDGILTLDNRYLVAFMDISSEKVFDIWEIPPFGSFNDSVYNGLRPDRIDCVLVSNGLVTAGGGATNAQIRYDNYIVPYVKYLKKRGAKVHHIEKYGEAVVLR